MDEQTLVDIPTSAIIPESPVLSGQKAREILQQEIQERIQRCGQEVANALQRYNCRLDVGMLITVNGFIPQVNIVINQ